VNDGEHQPAPGQKGDQAPAHQSISNDKGALGEVIKGEAITMPANMMELFQQFMASISNKEKGKEVAAQPEEGMTHEKRKQDKEELPGEVAESSVQGEARGNIVIKAPYCYHCLTRGHAKEECIVHLICDICESSSHVIPRCPLLKKMKKLVPMTCGYAIDGLGFSYIPHSSATRTETKVAIIQVIEGELSSTVQAKMQRSIPTV
jgi:hypothetical protein